MKAKVQNKKTEELYTVDVESTATLLLWLEHVEQSKGEWELMFNVDQEKA